MTSSSQSVKVKFFALVREQIGLSECVEQINGNDTVEALKHRLQLKNDNFNIALCGPVVMACNQTIVSPEHILCDGDEVAFFPPVTGG